MTSSPRGRFGKLFSGAVDVLTLAALGAAIWLLADTWAARKRTVAPDPPGPVAVGSRISDVDLVEADGRREKLNTAGDSAFRLIYVFKSDCPACAAQKARWIEFAAMAQEGGWNVTALTPEPLDSVVSSYFGDTAIRVMQLADPARGFAELQTAVVPTTIVVGQDGRVLSHRTGRLSAAAEDSLRGLLVGARLGSRGR